MISSVRLRMFTTWKPILALYILTTLFTFFIFPTYRANLTKVAGEEVTLLDARLHYTLEDVNILFDKIGDQGRKINRVISGRIDMIFPIVYGLFFFLSIVSLSQKFTDKRWGYLSIFPTIGVCFDYFENFTVLGLLQEYPDLSTKEVAFCSNITFLKWMFVFTSLAVLCTMGTIVIVKKLKAKKS